MTVTFKISAVSGFILFFFLIIISTYPGQTLGLACPRQPGLLVVGNCWLLIFPVIEEANWLTLPEDVSKPGDGFDAVICLGNSFAHLPDFKGNSDT